MAELTYVHVRLLILQLCITFLSPYEICGAQVFFLHTTL